MLLDSITNAGRMLTTITDITGMAIQPGLATLLLSGLTGG